MPSRTGHAGGGVKLFKLDCGMIFGLLRIAVMAFGFLQLLSDVFVVVEESFALELMAYNSDLRLCTENQ